jgi:pimeloyl-ACP methyl ester carboxylesterase
LVFDRSHAILIRHLPTFCPLLHQVRYRAAPLGRVRVCGNPYLMRTPGNPDGPLTSAQAAKMTASLTADADAFYDQFATDFFSVDGRVVVSEERRQDAVTLAKQARKAAALECLTTFGTTDFRDDLTKVTIPTLVIQGDSDFIVFYEGSGKRTHAAIPHSELHVIGGGPHGVNVSHAEEWNRVVIEFLAK